MFLELCEAYTGSINQGSIPSIEGAWTSLCKNENLRGIKQAISSYEQKMDAGSYLDKKKQECFEYSQLKHLNKKVMNEVLL